MKKYESSSGQISHAPERPEFMKGLPLKYDYVGVPYKNYRNGQRVVILKDRKRVVVTYVAFLRYEDENGVSKYTIRVKTADGKYISVKNVYPCEGCELF